MKRIRIALPAVAAFAAGIVFAQGSPPRISHPIDGYLVTRAENNCLECHDKPGEIGKKRAKGANVPAPASHYDGKAGAKTPLAAGHFNCTTCHTLR